MIRCAEREYTHAGPRPKPQAQLLPGGSVAAETGEGRRRRRQAAATRGGGQPSAAPPTPRAVGGCDRVQVSLFGTGGGPALNLGARGRGARGGRGTRGLDHWGFLAALRRGSA